MKWRKAVHACQFMVGGVRFTAVPVSILAFTFDQGGCSYLVVFIQLNQAHALRGTTDGADIALTERG